MTKTVQNVIDAVRRPINDEDGTRVPDAEMIGYVEAALRQIRKDRPDLFLGQFKTAIADMTAASVLPIADQYFHAVVDHVMTRCELKDDEFAVNARAALGGKLAEGLLK